MPHTSSLLEVVRRWPPLGAAEKAALVGSVLVACVFHRYLPKMGNVVGPLGLCQLELAGSRPGTGVQGQDTCRHPKYNTGQWLPLLSWEEARNKNASATVRLLCFPVFA